MPHLMPVTKIQRFSTHDGPGVRTTVFLKGCPLRCAWCHNPETQSVSPEIFYTPTFCLGCGACGKICPSGAHQITEEGHLFSRDACTRCMQCAAHCPSGALENCTKQMTPEEIAREVLRDKLFYASEGGVTLSGGEPTLHGEALLQLLSILKAEGVHTVLETCGYFDPQLLPALVPLVDLFLWDVKDTCDERHRQYTGKSNELILHNLRSADALGAKNRMRCIMVHGVNMDETHCRGIAQLYAGLTCCEGVELIPCHALGQSKTAQLGKDDRFDPNWIPDSRDMQSVRRMLRPLVRLL